MILGKVTLCAKVEDEGPDHEQHRRSQLWKECGTFQTVVMADEDYNREELSIFSVVHTIGTLVPVC